MQNSSSLKLQNLLADFKNILFVGVGNRLKSDDAIGIIICEKIISTENHKVLIVESGIEKFVGKINRLTPDISVIIDCTDFDKTPGFWDLVPIDKILDHTLHTHTISLKRISEFFEMPVYILGIQPKNVMFGEDVSEEVYKTAGRIQRIINKKTGSRKIPQS